VLDAASISRSRNAWYEYRGRVGGAGGGGELAGVEGWVDTSLPSRAGYFPGRRGGGELPARHSVRRVIEQQDGQIHVASGGMDEVIAADGQRVAVARHHDHESDAAIFTRGAGRPVVEVLKSRTVSRLSNRFQTATPGQPVNAGSPSSRYRPPRAQISGTS
jgi:hypothetical protein